MRFLLENLLGLLYLLAIVGGIGWWLWMVRSSRHPAKQKRSQTENAELARLRAQLSRLNEQSGNDQLPR